MEANVPRRCHRNEALYPREGHGAAVRVRLLVLGENVRLVEGVGRPRRVEIVTCVERILGLRCTAEGQAETEEVPEQTGQELLPRELSAYVHRQQDSFKNVKRYNYFYVGQNPVHWAAQNVLHFTPWHHSDTNSTSLGSILAMQHNYAQRLFTHISTTVYSQVLIYTAEWTRALWRERKCPNFEMVAKGDSNQGYLDCESGILPLSYCAPQHVLNATKAISYKIVSNNVRQQIANKNQIRWWSNVKTMTPTAPHSEALVIQTVGRQQRRRTQIR